MASLWLLFTLATLEQLQAPQKVGNAIHWVNLYSVNSTVSFPNTSPLDRDLSSGQSYPMFEQLRSKFTVINLHHVYHQGPIKTVLPFAYCNSFKFIRNVCEDRLISKLIMKY